MRGRPLRLLTSLIFIMIAGYLAAVGYLYTYQRDILYPSRETVSVPPAAAGFPDAEEQMLVTSDGEKVIAWHVPAQKDKAVLLFFPGNGDVLARLVPRFREMTEDGTGLLALSYRGYGGSSGHPTETGLLADADAAYDFAAARYARERIAAWGFSLGTGPAVALASTHQFGKLILEAPYTSAADVAAAVYPFVPVRLLMHDQFH
jgi:fermentation-respiration switch protein FrsA (DUF1100 family)